MTTPKTLVFRGFRAYSTEAAQTYDLGRDDPAPRIEESSRGDEPFQEPVPFQDDVSLRDES